MLTCCDCGQEIETTRGAAWQISGFEMDRAEGGTNHVLWRKRTGEVMCATCVTTRKYGKPDPNQLTLDSVA